MVEFTKINILDTTGGCLKILKTSEITDFFLLPIIFVHLAQVETLPEGFQTTSYKCYWMM